MRENARALPLVGYDPSVDEGERSVVKVGGALDIAKVDAPARQVFGWASVVIEKDGGVVVDHQGDVIEPDELEKAVYDFMLDWRESGDMHDGQPATGRAIESMVFTVEKQRALGIPEGTMPVGWWLGVQFADDESFNKVCSGERTAFSIEGQGFREPFTLED